MAPDKIETKCNDQTEDDEFILSSECVQNVHNKKNAKHNLFDFYVLFREVITWM